jgi:hypothetical protein
MFYWRLDSSATVQLGTILALGGTILLYHFGARSILTESSEAIFREYSVQGVSHEAEHPRKECRVQQC